MTLTQKQKDLMKRLQKGEELVFSRYASSNSKYAYWGKRLNGKENPVKTVISLINHKYLELVPTKTFGTFDVKLTTAGFMEV
jgi:hypothetical protein